MRIATSAVAALAILQPTLANPIASESSTNALSQRQPDIKSNLFERALPLSDLGFGKREAEAAGLNTHDLEKRRGGGGRGGGSSSSGSSSSGSSSGGGRGGSSGGSSSGASGSGSSGGSRGGSSSGSSSGSSGSSSSSSGSRGGSSSSGSSSSSGGRGGSGSVGSSPSYGGGRYYGGGATSSYRSGSRSPGGILPFALAGGAIGFAGAALLWPHAYVYPWHTGYNYRHGNNTNRTNTRVVTRQDTSVTLPVTCLCAQDQSCSCDDNNNSTYFDEFFGDDGFNDTLDDTVATIQVVNGTNTVVLNGTLSNDASTSAASAMLRLQARGYVAMAAGLTVSLLVL